jgi:hypothetical protein
MILLLVVFIVSAAVISAGMYLTFRAFQASEARAAGVDTSGHEPPATVHVTVAHDQAATELLKRFFDGKTCTVCQRPIPPVQRTGLKPGILDPATHVMRTWDHIPNDHLPSALETQLPLCPACVVAESFRQHHPELVVDRDRSGHAAPAPNRLATGS